jgi:IS4 transposase
VASQNRREFRALLSKALAVDPEKNPQDRLATLLLQREARTLLDREDQLFLEPDTTGVEESK